MKKIGVEDLRRLQLNILKAVDTYCRDNTIKYSLAFGTLLGAVRHGGFIPWDDDIDIMMPREDYDRFVQNFKHERYEVLSFPDNKTFLYPFAKVSDSKTILIEECRYKCELGVNIDIFPIDNSLSQNDMVKWLKKKQLLQGLFSLKNLTLSRERNLIKNVIILVTRIVSVFINQRKLCYIIQKMAQQFNSTSEGYMGILSTADTKLKFIMPTKVFSNFKEINFEGIKFQCISDTDSYLKNTYGNYMQLPPEDQRNTHHSFDAFEI